MDFELHMKHLKEARAELDMTVKFLPLQKELSGLLKPYGSYFFGWQMAGNDIVITTTKELGIIKKFVKEKFGATFTATSIDWLGEEYLDGNKYHDVIKIEYHAEVKKGDLVGSYNIYYEMREGDLPKEFTKDGCGFEEDATVIRVQKRHKAFVCKKDGD